MAARLTDRVWDIADIVALIEDAEMLVRRLNRTEALPSGKTRSQVAGGVPGRDWLSGWRAAIKRLDTTWLEKRFGTSGNEQRSSSLFVAPRAACVSLLPLGLSGECPFVDVLEQLLLWLLRWPLALTRTSVGRPCGSQEPPQSGQHRQRLMRRSTVELVEGFRK
jgi:hypothetical protein